MCSLSSGNPRFVLVFLQCMRTLRLLTRLHEEIYCSACHLLARWFAEPISSTLKMEAICSSETSVETQRTTRRHIPEDYTLHNHRCENLKSYIYCLFCFLFFNYAFSTDRGGWCNDDTLDLLSVRISLGTQDRVTAGFRSFTPSLQANVGYYLEQATTASILIHSQSSIILPFDAMQFTQ
jgi:hypothetical protein